MFNFIKRLFSRPDVQAIGKAAAVAAIEESGLDPAVVEGTLAADQFLDVVKPGDNYLKAYTARLTAELVARRI